MQYKITEQYARSEEKPIAEFGELNDARFFIEKKSSIDTDEGKKLFYRLYDDSELMQEFNKENISVAYAQYAEGNSSFNTRMVFLVMININDSERKPIANFGDQNDANIFIESKCEGDNTVQDNDLFFIFNNRIVLDTLTRNIIAIRHKKSEGSGNNEKGSTFQPTALSRRPTPPGGPSDCWVEKDDDEK